MGKLNESILDESEILKEQTLPSGVLARVRRTICEINKTNANKRRYKREVWEKVFNDPEFKKRIANRQIVGEMEHPEGVQLKLDKDRTSHIVSHMYIDENTNTVKADFDLLPTDAGKFIHILHEAGMKVGASTRAEGELVESEEDGEKFSDVVADKYRFVTIDHTGDPSCGSTEPESIIKAVRKGYESKEIGKAVACALLEMAGGDDAKKLEEAIMADKQHEGCKCPLDGKKKNCGGDCSHAKEAKDEPMHPGACCSDCGKDATEAEYSSGTSKCCKKPICGEEEYGQEIEEAKLDPKEAVAAGWILGMQNLGMKMDDFFERIQGIGPNWDKIVSSANQFIGAIAEDDAMYDSMKKEIKHWIGVMGSANGPYLEEWNKKKQDLMGGEVEEAHEKDFKCTKCGNKWRGGMPDMEHANEVSCPKCDSFDVELDEAAKPDPTKQYVQMDKHANNHILGPNRHALILDKYASMVEEIKQQNAKNDDMGIKNLISRWDKVVANAKEGRATFGDWDMIISAPHYMSTRKDEPKGKLVTAHDFRTELEQMAGVEGGEGEGDDLRLDLRGNNSVWLRASRNGVELDGGTPSLNAKIAALLKKNGVKVIESIDEREWRIPKGAGDGENGPDFKNGDKVINKLNKKKYTVVGYDSNKREYRTEDSTGIISVPKTSLMKESEEYPEDVAMKYLNSIPADEYKFMEDDVLKLTLKTAKKHLAFLTKKNPGLKTNPGKKPTDWQPKIDRLQKELDKRGLKEAADKGKWVLSIDGHGRYGVYKTEKDAKAALADLKKDHPDTMAEVQQLREICESDRRILVESLLKVGDKVKYQGKEQTVKAIDLEDMLITLDNDVTVTPEEIEDFMTTKESKVKMNEGTYSDFISHHGSTVEKLLKKARQVSIDLANKMKGKSEDEYIAAVNDKMGRVENVYDIPVVDLIDNLLTSGGKSNIDLEAVARVAMNIQNQYGTETRQVVNALEDVFGEVGSDVEEALSNSDKKWADDAAKKYKAGEQINEPKPTIQHVSGIKKFVKRVTDKDWDAGDNKYNHPYVVIHHSDVHDVYESALTESACRCFVRHAITPEEREQVGKNLDYARSVGDNVGTMLSIMQLGHCPSADKDDVKEGLEVQKDTINGKVSYNVRKNGKSLGTYLTTAEVKKAHPEFKEGDEIDGLEEAGPIQKKQDPYMPSSGCEFCGKDDVKIAGRYGDYCSDACMKADEEKAAKSAPIVRKYKVSGNEAVAKAELEVAKDEFIALESRLKQLEEHYTTDILAFTASLGSSKKLAEAQAVQLAETQKKLAKLEVELKEKIAEVAKTETKYLSTIKELKTKHQGEVKALDESKKKEHEALVLEHNKQLLKKYKECRVNFSGISLPESVQALLEQATTEESVEQLLSQYRKMIREGVHFTAEAISITEGKAEPKTKTQEMFESALTGMVGTKKQ